MKDNGKTELFSANVSHGPHLLHCKIIYSQNIFVQNKRRR